MDGQPAKKKGTFGARKRVPKVSTGYTRKIRPPPSLGYLSRPVLIPILLPY